MIMSRGLSSTLMILVLVVSQFHLLRNLSDFYYVFIVISFFISIWLVVSNWSMLTSNEKSIIILFSLLMLFPIFPMIFQVFLGGYTNISEIFVATSRVMFSLPIYLSILSVRSDRQQLNVLVLTCVVITLIAALSIPYQIIFGPIEWFAESSERSGMSRYASLFGSLTALGIVCGFGILIAAISITSPLLFSFVTVGIAVGSILSLQKAALVNLAISFVLLPFLLKLRIKNLFFISIFLCVFALSGWALFGEFVSGYLSSFSFFSGNDSINSDDYSLIESVHQRLFELPEIAIEHRGLQNLFFGLGPKGGGGTFGFPEEPMSHNGLIDTLLIGGVLYFLLFLYVLYYHVRLILIAKNNVIDLRYYYVGLFVIVGVLINIPFSNLVFFSPSGAMFLALATKIILACSQKRV